MTAPSEDAIKVLERVQRILLGLKDHAQVMNETFPEYARGARFAYKQAKHLIQNEIDTINKDRAARAAIQGDK